MITRRYFIAWVLGLLGGCHMPRGLPDDSNVVKKGFIYSLSDDAELAARLGGLQGIDRMGDVVFAQRFEQGFAGMFFWKENPACEILLSSNFARSGGVSVYMATRLAANSYCSWVRGQMYPLGGYCGAEQSFYPGNNMNDLFMLYDLYTGARWYQFYLRYRHTTGVLSVQVPGPAYVPIGTVPVLFASNELWHNMKLVVDIDNLVYVRALIDGQSFLLGGVAPYSVGSLLSPHINVGGSFYNVGALKAETYLDDFILTQNEP